MNREQQLRLSIRQNTEDSLHYAREAQRLERELFEHLKVKTARRSAALTVKDQTGGAA